MLPSSRGLWVVTSYSVVVGYQRFRSPCCLHLQDEVTEMGKKWHRSGPGLERCSRCRYPIRSAEGVIRQPVLLASGRRTSRGYRNATQRRKPQDLDLNHHRRECLKTRIFFLLVVYTTFSKVKVYG
jgi:hypothetical protein